MINIKKIELYSDKEHNTCGKCPLKVETEAGSYCSIYKGTKILDKKSRLNRCQIFPAWDDSYRCSCCKKEKKGLRVYTEDTSVSYCPECYKKEMCND